MLMRSTHSAPVILPEFRNAVIFARIWLHEICPLLTCHDTNPRELVGRHWARHELARLHKLIFDAGAGGKLQVRRRRATPEAAATRVEESMAVALAVRWRCLCGDER